MQLEMEPFDQRADGVSSWGNPSLYGSFSAVQHMYTSHHKPQGRLLAAVPTGEIVLTRRRCTWQHSTCGKKMRNMRAGVIEIR